MADNNLFPVFDVPGLVETEDAVGTEYKPAPLWDFEKNDFVLNGAGQPIYGTGYDAWVLWCIKTIETQRYAHYGYSNNAGIEADEAFKQPDRAARESYFERTITEALLADPKGRTIQVKDFVFEWKADTLGITCTIIGKAGNTAVIQADLTTTTT